MLSHFPSCKVIFHLVLGTPRAEVLAVGPGRTAQQQSVNSHRFLSTRCHLIEPTIR